MRRSLRQLVPVLSALLFVPACASSGATGAPTPIATRGEDTATPVQLRRGVEGTQTVVQKGAPLGGIVDGSVQRAWAALQAAYDDVGLTVTTRVPANGMLASVEQRLVRLNGRRASFYVDCGSDLSGPVADDAQVLLTVTSAVQAGADGTTIVGTRVDAEARPRGRVEGVRDCTSTKRLETLILQKVREGVKG